jgi:hypothetical protein
MMARLSRKNSNDGQHCAATDLEYAGPVQPTELIQLRHVFMAVGYTRRPTA